MLVNKLKRVFVISMFASVSNLNADNVSLVYTINSSILSVLSSISSKLILRSPAERETLMSSGFAKYVARA